MALAPAAVPASGALAAAAVPQSEAVVVRTGGQQMTIHRVYSSLCSDWTLRKKQKIWKRPGEKTILGPEEWGKSKRKTVIQWQGVFLEVVPKQLHSHHEYAISTTKWPARCVSSTNERWNLRRRITSRDSQDRRKSNRFVQGDLPVSSEHAMCPVAKWSPAKGRPPCCKIKKVVAVVAYQNKLNV